MTKKHNKRFGRKKALQWKSDSTYDSIRAARRNYGEGLAR